MARTLRVGTRGSRLSLRQTQIFVDALRHREPGVRLETVVIHSAGDRAAAVPLEQLEGIGFFAKELEAAVAERRCDVAVHSAKDLPTALHADLCLGAVLSRADPRDVLVSRGNVPLAELPFGARVATSSLRRAAQLRARRPDLVVVSIRGNVDTRLAKLDRGDADALCIAAAGLVRMGWEDRVSEWLEPDVMLPAPAQGALAVEARRDDAEVLALLRLVDDGPTHEAVTAERAFVARLGTGCRAPAGALATVERGRIALEGLLASEDGRIVRRQRGTAPVGAARWLGLCVADRVFAGSGEITGQKPARAGGAGAREARAVRGALDGRRIVVTRPREDGRLRRLLEAEGAEVLECPTIRIAQASDYGPLDAALGRAGDYGWIVFTSRNAVAAVMGRLAARGSASASLGRARLAVIGPATDEALREHGLRADLSPGEFRAEALVAAFGRHDLRGVRVLLPRAAEARDVLPEGLRALGAVVDVVPAYRTEADGAHVPEVLAAVRAGGVDAVTFTSPSTVRHFLRLAGPDALQVLEGVLVACIGPVTADVARASGMRVGAVAATYTLAGLVDALRAAFSARTGAAVTSGGQ